MGMIEFDFQKASSQADQLEELAKRMKQLAAVDYSNTMQELSYSWKGTSADIYMRKAGRLEDKMKQTANELQQTAASLRMAAEKVKKAELKAEELAKQRNR